MSITNLQEKIDALQKEAIELIERGILKLPENVHSNLARRLVETLSAVALLQVTQLVEEARVRAQALHDSQTDIS